MIRPKRWGPEPSGSHTLAPGTWKGSNVDEIKGIARVKFRPGKVEEWKRLSALFQHQPFDAADHGHRLRHGRSAGHAEREDERAARKRRPEAVYAVDRVARSGTVSWNVFFRSPWPDT